MNGIDHGNPELFLEVKKLGHRALRACELAAAGGRWTSRTVRAAADGLAQGSRSVGVYRRWPRLAASLKRIASTAAAREMRVSS